MSRSIRHCYRLTVIGDILLIVYATGSLVRRIGHPDRADPEPTLFTSHQQVFPQRLICFLQVISTSYRLSYRHVVKVRLTLGYPVPGTPMRVTSLGCGFGLSTGVHFFTSSFKGASGTVVA